MVDATINITVAIQYFFLFIICKNKRDIPSIGFTILLILKDFLNYLWMPIHVIGIALFTTICIFLGFNIMGIRLAFNKAFKYSLQASIVFSFNYLLLTLLKILGVVTYNYNTVDDVYFVQSLGRLFTRFNWPDWAYGILGRISIVEFLFYFVLSIIIAKSIKINFKTSLYKTGISYGIGLCFLGIITTFIGFII